MKGVEDKYMPPDPQGGGKNLPESKEHLSGHGASRATIERGYAKEGPLHEDVPILMHELQEPVLKAHVAPHRKD